MTSELFIEQLHLLAPPREGLQEQNLADDLIERLINGYKAIPLNTITHYTDELLRLISLFDVSSLEIGMLTFNNKIEKHGDYFLIGSFEVDPICLNSLTGEIVKFEEDLIGVHILNYCAQNGASLLDALIHYSKFISESSAQEEYQEDDEQSLKVATECSLLAGGDKYLSFYKSFFGI